MVNNEKLKLFLEDSDIEKVQASDPEKYKLLLDKVHLVSDTKEKIGKLKDELSGNLEDRVDKLLLYIDEAEKETVIEDAKSMVNKKDVLIGELRKKADKKIPFIGTAIFDWAMDLMKPSIDKDPGVMDKLFGKIGLSIGTAILGFLGLKKGYESLSDKGGGSEKFIVKDDGNIELKDNLEDIEGKRNFYYKTGIGSLMHLSGNNLKFDESTINSQIKFNNKPLGELKNIAKSGKMDGVEISNIDNKVLKSILSEDSVVLLKSSFKKNILKNTLENNKGTLESLLGSEFSNIESELLKKGELDIDKLSLNAISILFLFSVNSFGLLSLDVVKDKFSGVQDYFSTTGLDVDNIISDIESKSNGLVSKGLINEFKDKYGITKAWGEENGDDLLIKFEDSENIEELKKLIIFKEWLISDAFKGEKSKTLLAKFGKENIFLNNLDYVGVIALYTVLGGEKNLNNLNTIDLPILYKIISFVLGRQNAAYGSSYLSDVTLYFTLDNNTDDIFKDKNDKKALNIIIERIGIDYLKLVYREVTGKLGMVGLFENKPINDISAIVGGYMGSKVGTKMMEKGAILKGAWLKRFAYFAMFSGIASSLHTTYNNGSEMLLKLSDFGKEENIDNLSEKQLKELIIDAENFNENIVTREINGEIFLLYIGKNGLELIHNNNIYKLGVGFNRYGSLEEIGNNIMKTLGSMPSELFDNYVRDEIPEEISDYIATKKEVESFWRNDKLQFKGKEYDFRDIKINKNKLIIGGELQYDLNTFLEKFLLVGSISPEKLISTEKNKNIIYKIIEKGNSDSDNLILLKQGEIIKT